MASLKTIGVKAVTIVAMVATLAATTTQAQANPNFSFSFNFGNGGYSMPRPQPVACMNNHTLMQQLRGQGYYDIQFRGETYRNYPEFYATYNGWVYSFQVNRCNGQIHNLTRVRPVYYRPAPQPQHPWWFNQRPGHFGGHPNNNFYHN